MSKLFSAVFLVFLFTSGAYSQFSSHHFNKIIASVNGGLSLATGEQAEFLRLGFCGGADLLYKPIEHFAIGLSPTFNLWKRDGTSKEYSEIWSNIGINGALRTIIIPDAKLSPYIQVGSGMNIQFISQKEYGSGSPETDIYWGMVITGGVSLGKFDLAVNYNFVRDDQYFQFHWITFTLGLVAQ